MNEVLKTVVSLSVSGSLVIGALLLSGRLLRRRVSRRWQYYIWLLAIARLLLPLAPLEVNWVGTLFQGPGPEAAQSAPVDLPDLPAETGGVSGEEIPPAAPEPEAPGIWGQVEENLWLVWLGVGLLLLVRKITVYQGFVRLLRAGQTEVSDVARLDRLAEIGAELGVRRPVELCVNGLAASPLLIGFFRPRIILPSAELGEADFDLTVRHELTHCKRGDLFYKWLVQLTICLHWFNPLVWVMGRKISRACELSCDEAVLSALDGPGRRAYGDMLLRAAGAGENGQVYAVPLHEGAALLKERLGAIMGFKKTSKWAAAGALALAAVLTVSAAAAGCYPAKAVVRASAVSAGRVTGGTASEQAKRYYEAGSFPLFEIAFSRLSAEEQSRWLEKLYEDEEIAFFSVALNQFSPESPVLDRLAERLYQDDAISYFAVLTNRMDGETLEAWLDRALADKKFSFQSVLFNRLNEGTEWEDRQEAMDRELEEKLDAVNRELAKQQAARYKAAGVVMEGKDYYYKGQLVNVFLDHRADSSFYTLNVNPKGTVSVKILRGKDGQITGAACMTDAEVEELLGDWDEPDDEEEPDGSWDGADEIDVPVKIAEVKDGEFVWLGTCRLAEGDRVFYNVTAERGKQLAVGFARPEEKTPATRYQAVTATRQGDIQGTLWHGDAQASAGEPSAAKTGVLRSASFPYPVSSQTTGETLMVKIGPMVWKEPLKAGEYALFVHAPDGALGNVEGHVTIVKGN